MQIRTLPFVAHGRLLVVLLGGCSAISGLNPFKKKEKSSGRPAAVLPQAAERGRRRHAVDRRRHGDGGLVAAGRQRRQCAGQRQPRRHVGRRRPGGRAVDRIGRQAERAARRCRRSSMAGASSSTTPSGTVSSLSPGGGKAWSVSLAPEGEKKSRTTGGGIAASGNAIFAATGFGELVALDAATGNRIWTFKMSAPAHSAPTAAGGKVFVVSATNVLHAVNQADGTEAWQYPGIPETAGVLSARQPGRLRRHRRRALFLRRGDRLRYRRPAS